MMSNRHRVTPTDGWPDLPSDRSAVGQRKLEELQRQIDQMQSGRREKEILQQKLGILQKREKEKKTIQDKVVGRNSPRLLFSEMERIYGDTSPLHDRNVTPDQERRIIDTVIQQRTKEFSLKQQEAAIKARYLDKERRRLQEARQHVEDARKALLNNMTPDEPRVSEPREERVKNSNVLPIKLTEFKGRNWKIKVKYVPVSIDDQTETVGKYNSAVMEGVEVEGQDDTVKAFLSLTQKNKQPTKKSHRNKTYYVPYALPDIPFKEQKIRLRNRLDRKPELKGNLKKRAKLKDQKSVSFQDSFKLGVLHRGYRPLEGRPEFQHSVNMFTDAIPRTMDRRIKNAKFPEYEGIMSEPVNNSSNFVTERLKYFPTEKNDQYPVLMRRRQKSAPYGSRHRQQPQVKYKAIPSHEDELIHRFRYLGGTL